MLTSISTQLGRSVRHKEILPIFLCSSLNIALAAIQAAQSVQKPIILVFDSHQLGSLPLPMAIYYIKTLVKHSDPAVSVLCNFKEEQFASSIMSIDKISYCINWDEAKRSRFSSQSLHIDRIVISNEIPEPEVAEYLVNKCGVMGFCYSTETMPFDKGSLKAITSLSKAIKIPIILDNHHLPKWNYDRLVQARVGAVILRDVLNDAYTAGIRTALRDRSVQDPTKYEQKALLAVEDVVRNYLLHPFDLN